MTDPSIASDYWDGAYASGEQALSWFAPSAAVSLCLITAADVATNPAVIDIGGGTSRLVDSLPSSTYWNRFAGLPRPCTPARSERIEHPVPG